MKRIAAVLASLLAGWNCLGAKAAAVAGERCGGAGERDQRGDGEAKPGGNRAVSSAARLAGIS